MLNAFPHYGVPALRGSRVEHRDEKPFSPFPRPLKKKNITTVFSHVMKYPLKISFLNVPLRLQKIKFPPLHTLMNYTSIEGVKR